MIAFISFAEDSGSDDAQMADTTAMPSAPAFIISVAFLLFIPPIATRGLFVCMCNSSNPFRPHSLIVSVFVGVGQIEQIAHFKANTIALEKTR